jgi:RND family efflux transporter MFP subunit
MKKKKIWIVLAIALLLAGGGGYLTYSRYFALAEAPPEPELETATVYQDDIVLTADGSGELLPAVELALGFQASGVLVEVPVSVGDQVQAGDVLARLDDTDAREAVTDAELQMTQAEINLALATNEIEAGLAQANLDAAQADYEETVALSAHVGDQLTSARINLEQAIDALADAEEAYETAWDPARDWELFDQRRAASLEAERERTEDGLKSAQDSLAVAQASYNLALIGIDESAVQDAQIKVTDAQVALANEPFELQQLELALAQAQANLATAQRALEETVLTAPIAGKVIDVAAEAGESVSSGSIVTLADLENPQIRFWVEESDMSSVAVGNEVNVLFDALPDESFPGEIVRVDPALVDVDGTLAVQATAMLDPTSQPEGLLSGMTVEVEVVYGEARDAVLAPVEALRELGAGQYAVFVVEGNDELVLRSVEIGLQDFVNAEVISGLETGEVVSIGETETNDASSEVPEAEMPMGMPFMR